MKRIFLLLSIVLLLAGCADRTWVTTPPNGSTNSGSGTNTTSNPPSSNPTTSGPATAPMAALIQGPNAFSTGSYILYTASSDGTGLTQVFTRPRDLQSAHVLPDGTKAVFAALAEDGYSQIYYLSPVDSTTEPVQLTTTPVHKTGAILSGDGSKIVFLQLHPAQTTPDDAVVWDVVTMDADGSNLNVISHPEGYFMSHPFFSPDGKTIVLQLDEGFFGGDIGVFTMNADGTNLQRLTPGGIDGILAVAPAFSPDGKQVVFSSVGWDDVSMYIVNSDGTDLRRIGAKNSCWGDPLFIGERVMFVMQNQGFYQIYSVKPDGTDLKKVTSNLNNVFERSPF